MADNTHVTTGMAVLKVTLLIRMLSMLAAVPMGGRLPWHALAGIVLIGAAALVLLLGDPARRMVRRYPHLVLLDTGLVAGVALASGAESPFTLTFMTSALLVGLLVQGGLGAIIVTALLAIHWLVLAAPGSDDGRTSLLIPFVLVTLWSLGFAVQRADRGELASRQALQELVAETAARGERVRVARDMHDTFAKTLQAISLTAAALPAVIDHDAAEGKTVATELREMSAAAVQDARSLMTELRRKPDAGGLACGLDNLADEFRASGTVTLVTDLDAAVDVLDHARPAVVLAVAEALENVRRHARATTVTITLRRQGGHAVVTVQDDGVGTDAVRLTQAEQNGHYGRRGMRERVEQAGGTFHFASAPGQGTRIVLTLPRRDELTREGAVA